MNGETDKIGKIGKIGMRTGGGINSGLKPATLCERRLVRRRLMRALCFAAAVLLFSAADFAQAQSLRQGISAFNRQDYGLASGIFVPLAERGEASVQNE